MNDRAAQLRLQQLREHRVRKPPNTDLRPLFEATAATLKRDRKRLSNTADAWASVCPPQLLPRTAILTLSRGALTIAVPDAPTSFELDRALRAGAETHLIRACLAPVRKVKLVINPEAFSPRA